MEILYLLIPLSAVLVLAILGVFGWALWRGQFEDLEHEGERILLDEPPVAATTADTALTAAPTDVARPPQSRSEVPGALDADQAAAQARPEQSRQAQQLS